MIQSTTPPLNFNLHTYSGDFLEAGTGAACDGQVCVLTWLDYYAQLFKHGPTVAVIVFYHIQHRTDLK